MTTQTFPISRAESNLVNRLTFIAFLLLIALMTFLVFDSKSLLFIVIQIPFLAILIYALVANKFTEFTVDDNTLGIKRALYGKSIAISSLDLQNTRVLDLTKDINKPLRPIIRTNGIGLPYYQAGWFRLHNRDKALLFTTNMKNVVHIPTNEGYALMLSVDDTEKFLESIRR